MSNGPRDTTRLSGSLDLQTPESGGTPQLLIDNVAVSFDQQIFPFSILRYVDNDTASTSRDGSVGDPYLSTAEATADITDNATGKRYSLIVIKDDGATSNAKPFIYRKGTSIDNFVGGAKVPNIVGRYEFSGSTFNSINTDALTNTVDMHFIDCIFLSSSLIFSVATNTASFKFTRCTFLGSLEIRQVNGEFDDCVFANISLTDFTLTGFTWKFRRCTFNGAFTTVGSASSNNFTFFGCEWLPSSSFAPVWGLSVTCDDTFPHESNANVTIFSRLSKSELVDYDNSSSGLSASDVKSAIDELSSPQGIFAEAINNSTTTNIPGTGTYELINFGGSLTQIVAKNWDLSGGRIRFIGTSFTGLIRMMIEIHLVPSAPTGKDYDIRGHLNASPVGIFPTLETIDPGDYDQIVLEFRVLSLVNGDLVDARIRQLSGLIDANPTCTMATYEAIEDQS